MNLSLIKINRKTVINWYIFIIAINLLIGFFFWIVHIDNFGFVYHMVAPQIGAFIIVSSVLGALYVFRLKHSSTRFIVILIAILVGAIIAGVFESQKRETYFINLLFGILISSIIYGFVFYRENMTITETNLEIEKIRQIQMEKKITEARLKTLQAQIEPHFLFNTLTNILTLFDTDFEKGKSMQKDLILYLKSSLSKIRMDFTTIGDEIDLITAYLNIFKERMGDRLNFNAEVHDHLQKIPFPPLMIQPLVENAIKHGIEPKVDGGEIAIQVLNEDNILRIKVSDTGMGMREDSGPRIGLSNIQERLNLLYGRNGRLILTENQPNGVHAIIEVPYGDS